MGRATRSLRLLVGLFPVLVVTAMPSAADPPKAGSALNMQAVGRNDLDGRGFNGDVFVHNGVAYVGHWGFTDWATGNTRFCPEEPNSGVAVLDVSDPADPTVVSHLQNPAGTSAEDVVAYTALSGPLAGRDIAAAGIQVCGGTSPTRPTHSRSARWTPDAARQACTSSRSSTGPTSARPSPTSRCPPASTRTRSRPAAAVMSSAGATSDSSTSPILWHR